MTVNIYLFFLVYCILLVVGGHIILLHVKVLCTSNLHVLSSRTTYTLIILKPEHSHNCEYTFLKLLLLFFFLLYRMKNQVKFVFIITEQKRRRQHEMLSCLVYIFTSGFIKYDAFSVRPNQIYFCAYTYD